jgi:hypothetical protein
MCKGGALCLGYQVRLTKKDQLGLVGNSASTWLVGQGDPEVCMFR